MRRRTSRRRAEWRKIKRSRSARVWRRELRSPNSPMAASSSAMSARSRCCWRAGEPKYSRSACTARTMAAPLSKGSLSMTRCAVRGITRASTFGPAKPCTRRPSAPLIHGLWSNATAKFVREKRGRSGAGNRAKSGAPNRIVIVGGGAAGFAAAEMLRRRKYEGEIVMLSSDDAPPVDRPNLSKDYLAGSAPEDWLPLRPELLFRRY
jgi:Pyridine nucleotide-disulphide oxidoreductase